MAIKVALFNHKGGVSKTTTTFHLGWMLASKGKRVIVVDADPQCNLTGMILEYTDWQELESFYEKQPERNIREGLAPAFESRPERIKAVECVPVERCEGLFLLPGHIRLSEYEVTLGFAQELSSSIHALRNLPGSIAYMLEETAMEFQADYMLIDMNPSLSSINQNILMISDYFLVPTNPDYFSAMAIDSLSTVLPKWRAWAKKAATMPILRDASYPFPQTIPRFLGTIIQNYRPRSGSPTRGFQEWVDKIQENVSRKLVPSLADSDMMLPNHTYHANGVDEHYCLSMIPDFNTLVTRSQKYRTPVFDLSPEQLEQVGKALENTLDSQERFEQLFSDLADTVMGMTSNAAST